MTYLAYMRISTAEERGMQKFSRQEKALNKYAEKKGIEFDKVFRDDASGKSFNRPEWQKLMQKLTEYKAGSVTIIFKDISRFTRDADNGYEQYMELMDSGVNLIFLDNPMVSTPYIKQLFDVAEHQDRISRKSLKDTVELLILVELDRAEKERTTLIKRIEDGIAASGKKQGRKPGTLDKMTDELHSDIVRYLNDRSVKQIDLMNKHNISRNTLKKYVETVQAEQQK